MTTDELALFSPMFALDRAFGTPLARTLRALGLNLPMRYWAIPDPSDSRFVLVTVDGFRWLLPRAMGVLVECGHRVYAVKHSPSETGGFLRARWKLTVFRKVAARS